MKNHGSESVDRISATKVSKLLTVLPPMASKSLISRNTSFSKFREHDRRWVRANQG
jgi:hypothetical protein